MPRKRPSDTKQHEENRNPFTRTLTEEEKAIQVVERDPRWTPFRGPDEEERAEALKRIDDGIRDKAQRTVQAIGEYAKVKANLVTPEWMTEEDLQIAKDAALPDKEVPFALKTQLRILESYKKQDTEGDKKPLAVTINLYGNMNTQNNYERIRLEDKKGKS